MNKKLLVGGFHLANVAGLGAQLLGALPPKPWVMILQLVLSAVAPSFGGIGHKMVFGGDQGEK